MLGLSLLERTIARQRSWIRWLLEGDVSTKLFHAVASGERSRNFILSITVDEQILMEQENKELVVRERTV